MKKKPKSFFVDPKNKKDRKKALDALKDKNFNLDDKDNEKVKGGFIERGSGGCNDDDKHSGEDGK